MVWDEIRDGYDRVLEGKIIWEKISLPGILYGMEVADLQNRVMEESEGGTGESDLRGEQYGWQCVRVVGIRMVTNEVLDGSKENRILLAAEECRGSKMLQDDFNDLMIF